MLVERADMRLSILFMKVFIVLLLGAFLSLLIKYTKVSRIRKQDAKMPKSSRGIALITAVLDRGFVFFALGFAFFLFWKGHLPLFLSFSCHYAFQLIGIVLLIIWMYLGWWGILSLGEFSGPRWAHLKERHAIVKTGVYRYVRHPLYASRIAAYLGLFLFFKNYIFLGALVFLVPFLYLQARSEEDLLIKVFGEEYRVYQNKVGMFFPLEFKQRSKSEPRL